MPHLFFTYIYHMVSFTYSLIPVGFRAILMSFVSFLSQKTYPGKSWRPEFILSRSYLRKCSIWPPSSIIINVSFFKDAINSGPLKIQTDKDYWKKIVTKLYLVSIAKDPSIRIKMHQTFFFFTFTTICLVSAEWMWFI